MRYLFTVSSLKTHVLPMRTETRYVLYHVPYPYHGFTGSVCADSPKRRIFILNHSLKYILQTSH